VSSIEAVGSLLSTDKVFLGKAAVHNASKTGTLNLDEVYLLITAKILLHTVSFKSPL